MADKGEITSGDELPPEDSSKKYDQEFFLDLAAKGKDAWNAWRRNAVNKYVRVTFEGVDFSIALGDGIDFSGFDFGDAADFSSCTWADIVGTTGRARFSGATFGDGATFVGTTFGNHADFSGATFGNRADFSGATFGDWADFSGATFGDWVTFVTMHIEAWFFARKWYLVWPAVGETTDPMSGVALEFQADFSGATFGFEANFASAIFHIPTGFTGATFGDRASFKGTVFKGPVTFTGKSKEESIRRLEVDEHGIRNASGVAPGRTA